MTNQQYQDKLQKLDKSLRCGIITEDEHKELVQKLTAEAIETVPQSENKVYVGV